MKGRPVDELVHEYMFPRRKSSDPQNFLTIVSRFLVFEVRQEVQAFYGHIETHEAKYPGLDYCHPVHRVRLSRWPWHRRLFRAFDGLRLTPSEIAGLTKWEGTRWAKERFEKEQGYIIRDTASDGIPPWVPPEERINLSPTSNYARDDSQETEDQRQQEERPNIMGDTLLGLEESDDDDDDDELESIGVELNQRLRERVAAHNAGDRSQPLDEDWEQWLKVAMETGEFPLVAEQIAHLARRGSGMTPEEIFPPRILDAARADQWHEIPDFLHHMIRQALETERQEQRQQQRATGDRDAAATPAAGAGSGSSIRGVRPEYRQSVR